MSRATWSERPVAAVCVSLLVLALSLFSLASAEPGREGGGGAAAFMVTIRHYGVDAREMERSVAIPLEDALSSLRGVVETASFSEYGKAWVRLRFASGTDGDAAMEAVRDVAERIHGRLPASAQRPEILWSDGERAPVWVAAIQPTHRGAGPAGPGPAGPGLSGALLERLVKPALERIPGSGVVELAGSGTGEMVVELDTEAAAALGLGMGDVAALLAGDDTLAAAGTLRLANRLIPIVADGRYATTAELGRACIPAADGKSVPLETIALIRERERPPDSLSRVNGERAQTVAVYPGGDASPMALSSAINKEVKKLEAEHGLSFVVLADSGADTAQAFFATLSAAIQGAFAVALASALLLGGAWSAGKFRHASALADRVTARPGSSQKKAHTNAPLRAARLVSVAAVPFALVSSAALLVVTGYGLDRFILAGLAAGLGTSVDAALLAAERLGASSCPEDGRLAMKRLVPSLASGSATTLVVLVPIAGLESLSPGVSRIAAGIMTVCAVSFVSTVFLMPPLVLGWSTSTKPGVARSSGSSTERDACPPGPASGLSRRVKPGPLRLAKRLLAVNARLCARRPRLVLGTSALLSLAGVVALLSMPLDPGGEPDDATLFAHVEFEPGASVESVDARLADYARAVAGIDGLLHIQTSAKRGSGFVLMSFDRAVTGAGHVARAARGTPLPGGFIWIQENTPDERGFEVVVAGDDDSECRRLAVEVAGLVAQLDFVVETVLNFKEGPADLVMNFDRERGATAGVGLADAASTLRRAVHGPVAYKRLGPGGEMDVRVTGRNSQPLSPEEVASTLLAAERGSVRADLTMRPSKLRDTGRVVRRDRRRIASITMRTRPVDPRKAGKAVQAALAGIVKPAGYTIEFDRSALEAADRIAGIGWSLLLAVLLVYMVTAAVTESFGAPLAILAALPPSLALPAIVRALGGASMNASVACAFVAVSGMVVNASVLTVDERRSRVALSRGGPSSCVGPSTRASPSKRAGELYSITRSRVASLLATSGTTVAGALPFLFIAERGGSMAASLSFVAALGTATSFFTALCVIPSLAVVAPGLFNSLSLTDPGSKPERTI